MAHNNPRLGRKFATAGILYSSAWEISQYLKLREHGMSLKVEKPTGSRPGISLLDDVSGRVIRRVSPEEIMIMAAKLREYLF